MAVPRSFPSMTSSTMPKATGTTKGMSACLIEPSRSRLRSRTSAPPSTSPILAISLGWIDNDPTPIQLRLPWKPKPSGVRTRPSRTKETTTAGTAARFQKSTLRREAHHRATPPTTAKTNCLRKIVKDESFSRRETIIDADRTMTSPMPTRRPTTPRRR